MGMEYIQDILYLHWKPRQTIHSHWLLIIMMEELIRTGKEETEKEMASFIDFLPYNILFPVGTYERESLIGCALVPRPDIFNFAYWPVIFIFFI